MLNAFQHGVRDHGIFHIVTRVGGASWWRYDIDTFASLLALCVGNPQNTDGFSSQTGLWCFLCCTTNALQTVELSVNSVFRLYICMPVIILWLVLLRDTTTLIAAMLRYCNHEQTDSRSFRRWSKRPCCHAGKEFIVNYNLSNYPRRRFNEAYEAQNTKHFLSYTASQQFGFLSLGMEIWELLRANFPRFFDTCIIDRIYYT